MGWGRGGKKFGGYGGGGYKKSGGGGGGYGYKKSGGGNTARTAPVTTAAYPDTGHRSAQLTTNG
jgi:hypothetical protein